MKLTKKIVIPLAIVVVLAAAYVGGLVYYSQRYLPATEINNKSYGGWVLQDVIDDMTNPISKKLLLQGKEGQEEEIELSEQHYDQHVDVDGLKEVFEKQTPYLWFIQGLISKSYTVENTIELDQKALENTVNNARLLSEDFMIAPADAYIEETTDDFVLMPEVEGTTLNKTTVMESIVSALETGEEFVDLEAQDCYLFPKVTQQSPELLELLGEMQAIGKLVITYDFADRQEVLDYDEFSSWVSYDVNKGIQVDKAEAEKYVTNLAYAYDTYRINRQFTPTGLAPIQVGGGIYGWQTNIEKSTEQLIETIKKGESVTIEPIYNTRGLHRTVDDLGNTYVEIDLSRQQMWLYVNGELSVETGIVSGAPTPTRQTPTGVFSIWSKETKRYISGEDYKFWVEYWMPIDWAGTGIHDAYWQPNFGGEQYLISGSHGCINTPIEYVAPIFHQVQVNTPVIVYKS